MLLAGLALLLFAGYAITLRVRSLAPRKAVHLLGERVLVPGAPAAFRLVGWDRKWEKPLELSRVRLSLDRSPGKRAVLARTWPGAAVAHLNTRIPGWPRGPAVLRAELDTPRGGLVLEAEVILDPEAASRMRLVPPHKELVYAPALISEGAAAGSEPGSQASQRTPAVFVLFPAGGRLSSSFATRLLVRVLDRRGRPVAGRLEAGEAPGQPVDPDGFALVTVAAGGKPGKLSLSFDGEPGRLAGEVALQHTPAQLDISTPRLLVAAGRPLALELRALSQDATLYLEAWWAGGWCASAETRLRAGAGRANLPLPSGIEGPVVVRARDDPFGGGKAVRDTFVLAGRSGSPDAAEGLGMLRRLPAAPGFWKQAGALSDSERTLAAVLSRVRLEAESLPLLADGTRAEREAVARRKERVRRFGLGLAAGVSLIAWLVVAWLLLGAVRAARTGQAREVAVRRRALPVALGALAVLALALSGGWVLLWWLTG